MIAEDYVYLQSESSTKTVSIITLILTIMKKFLLFVFCAMISASVFAQKTQSETTYQFTEARKPQVWVEPLVKPLVVEVKIMEGVPNFWKKTLNRVKVERELEGKLENIKNYGLFLFTEDTKSDMIVAATYNFYTNPNRTGDDDWYVLEIKGFPAKFTEWHTATPSDYEWMKIQGIQRATTNKEVFEKVTE